MPVPDYAEQKAEEINACDTATITYEDGSTVVLNRDQTGVGRWQFRAFKPEAGPDAVASGVITVAGVELFCRARCTVSSEHINRGESREPSVPEEPSVPATEGDAEPTE